MAGARQSEGLFQSAKVAAFGMVYMQGLSLLSGVVIARVLGAADYGVLNLARSLLSTVQVFGKLGLDLGLQRYLGEVSDSAERAQRFAQTRALRILVLILTLTLLGVAAAGGAAWLEGHVYQHPGFAVVLLGLGLGLPFLCDLSILGGAYRGVLHLSPSVLVEYVLMPTLRLVIIVVLFLLGWRLGAVVGGTTAAAIIAAVTLAWNARRQFATPVSTPGLWATAQSPVMRYSLVLTLSFAVVTLSRTVDVLILGHFLPAAQVGQYSVAQMMMAAIALFGSAVGQTTGARIARFYRAGDLAAMGQLLQHQARWISLLSIGICAVMAVWGHALMALFGPSFTIAPACLAVLALCQYTQSVLAPSGFALSMTGKQNQELVILLVGLVVGAAAGWVLVPVLGQLGAALTYAVGILVVNVSRVVMVHRRVGVLALSTSLVGITLAPLGVAFVMEWLRFRLRGDAGWIDAGVCACLFLAAHAAVTWRFVLTAGERSSLRDRFGRKGPVA